MQQLSALQLQSLMSGANNNSNNTSQGNTNALAALLFGQLLGQHQQQLQQPSLTVQSISASAALGNHSRMPSVVPPVVSVKASESSSMIAKSSSFSSAPVQNQATTASTLSKSPAVVASTESKEPDSSNKRATFLNKRSRATGAAYRNPNKKQKTTSGAAVPVTAVAVASPSTAVGRKPAVKTTSAGAGPRRDVNAFLLNEDFKGTSDVPDLLFPWKLHDMLDDADSSEEVKTQIVSWQEDGVSFAIHNDQRFVREIIPKYFGEEKDWDGFTKSLSSWGFVRFTSGAQKGAFIHRLLVRGKRSLCKQMRINGKTVRLLLWTKCDKMIATFVMVS
jgi:hypothetical protein